MLSIGADTRGKDIREFFHEAGFQDNPEEEFNRGMEQLGNMKFVSNCY